MKTTIWLEIEFEVDYDYQPFERATLEYPGCSESVEINEVKPVNIDKDLCKHAFSIADHCLEDYRDSHRGRDER